MEEVLIICFLTKSLLKKFCPFLPISSTSRCIYRLHCPLQFAVVLPRFFGFVHIHKLSGDAHNDGEDVQRKHESALTCPSSYPNHNLHITLKSSLNPESQSSRCTQPHDKHTKRLSALYLSLRASGVTDTESRWAPSPERGNALIRTDLKTTTSLLLPFLPLQLHLSLHLVSPRLSTSLWPLPL